MKQGFSAGCSLEVTLKFADYENLKPSFWCGLSEEWDSSEKELTREEIYSQIKEVQSECRKICEEKIDTDIYDVKEVKLFSQISKLKGKK